MCFVHPIIPIMIRCLIIEKMKNIHLCFSRNFEILLIRWIIGFFFGNLIGTFLNFFRSQKIWDGCFFFFFLFWNERISFLFYNKYKFIFIVKIKNIVLYWEYFIFFIQIRKIGFLFSIFIDSFKIGSLLYIIF